MTRNVPTTAELLRPAIGMAAEDGWYLVVCDMVGDRPIYRLHLPPGATYEPAAGEDRDNSAVVGYLVDAAPQLTIDVEIAEKADDDEDETRIVARIDLAVSQDDVQTFFESRDRQPLETLRARVGRSAAIVARATGFDSALVDGLQSQWSAEIRRWAGEWGFTIGSADLAIGSGGERRVLEGRADAAALAELTLAFGCVALDHSLSVVVNPPVMLRRCLWSEAVEARLRDDAERPDLAPDQLPERVTALAIDHHHVLIGVLGESSEETILRDRLRRLHNQATVARSWLGAAAEDLHLVLIGPPGGDVEDAWRRFANSVERDQRICRKLVWLPPADPTARAASRAAFLRRTFLARPWRDSAAPEQGALDWMAQLLTDIGSDSFSSNVAKRWFELLEQPDIDRDDLVEGLVEALEHKA